MAEDRESPQPKENVVKNPEALKAEVREGTRKVLDSFINQNPVVREQSRNMDRVQAALPEGRVKDAVGMALDLTKIPRALRSLQLEFVKRVIPFSSFVGFIPEQIGALSQKAVGFVGEKITESAPVKFAVGTVEGVMDGILGKRAAAPETQRATIENSHQILVGMARPEMGKQERKKMA
ncbi:MAG: hypothetical protein AAB557_05540 [Patescibacteria group bacterium]